MRPTEIYANLTSAQIQEAGFSGYFMAEGEMLGLTQLRERLSKVRGTPGFSDVENQIGKTIIFRTDSDSAKVSGNEWSQVFSLLNSYL